jgi:hypothetical protein
MSWFMRELLLNLVEQLLAIIGPERGQILGNTLGITDYEHDCLARIVITFDRFSLSVYLLAVKYRERGQGEWGHPALFLTKRNQFDSLALLSLERYGHLRVEFDSM